MKSELYLLTDLGFFDKFQNLSSMLNSFQKLIKACQILNTRLKMSLLCCKIFFSLLQPTRKHESLLIYFFYSSNYDDKYISLLFNPFLFNYCFISEYACDNLRGQGLILTKIQKHHLEIEPYTSLVIPSNYKSDQKSDVTLWKTKFIKFCCDIFQGQLFSPFGLRPAKISAFMRGEKIGPTLGKKVCSFTWAKSIISYSLASSWNLSMIAKFKKKRKLFWPIGFSVLRSGLLQNIATQSQGVIFLLFWTFLYHDRPRKKAVE